MHRTNLSGRRKRAADDGYGSSLDGMLDGIGGDTLASLSYTLAEKSLLFIVNTILCGKLGVGIMAYESILIF